MTEPNDTAVPPRRKRSIIANTAMNGVAQFASVFSTLVFFPLLVAAFGPAEYGVYVLALSVTSIAFMFDFGIGAATVRLVADRLSLDDVTGFARVVTTAAALLLAVGVMVGAAIAGVAGLAGVVFNVTVEQAQTLRTLLLIGAAMQLWYWPTSVAAHVLNGLERYDLVARTSLMSTVANVAVIGIVLLFGGGPVMLMSLGVLVMVGASIINMLTLTTVRPPGHLSHLPSRPVAEEIISSGIPVFMNSIAQFFNKEQVDRLVIGVVIGPTGVVLYEVAAKLSMLISQVAVLPTSAMLPVVSGVAARGDRDALNNLFLRGGRYITIAITPIVVTLAVLAGPFILVWFGEDFGASIAVAHLLILTQLFFPPLLMGDPILTGTGRLSRWVPRAFLLAVVNLVLSVALVSRMGPVGVALATLISSLLELPLYGRFMLRETGLPFSRWFKTTWAGYLLLPVAAVIAALTALTPLGDSFFGIALIAAVSLVAYWGSVYLMLFSRAEREWIGQRARRMTARST